MNDIKKRSHDEMMFILLVFLILVFYCVMKTFHSHTPVMIFLDSLQFDESLLAILLNAVVALFIWRQTGLLKDQLSITQSQINNMESQLDLMSKSLNNQTAALLYPTIQKFSIIHYYYKLLDDETSLIDYQSSSLISLYLKIDSIGLGIGLNAYYYLELSQGEKIFASILEPAEVFAKENLDPILTRLEIDDTVGFLKSIVEGKNFLKLKINTLCSDIYGTGFLCKSEKILSLPVPERKKINLTYQQFLKLNRTNDGCDSRKIITDVKRFIDVINETHLPLEFVTINSYDVPTKFEICNYKDILSLLQGEALKHEVK